MAFSDPKGGLPEIEEGPYLATVARLEDTEGTFGPQIKWLLQLNYLDDDEPVLDDHNIPAEFFMWTSCSLAKKSKAKPVAEAFLGHSIDEMTGEEVTAQVVGKRARTLVAIDPETQRIKFVSFSVIKPKAPRRGAAVEAEEPVELPV